MKYFKEAYLNVSSFKLAYKNEYKFTHKMQYY